MRHDTDDDRAWAPHCDQRVLHAPGECQACDEYPDWQQHREVAGIAYTGHTPTEDQVYCPAELQRTVDTINLWAGNRPYHDSPGC